MIDEHGIDSGKTAPEETRERILAAAREVMARKGKRGATTREIAETAGVNEATLFRHFGNKEALIVATAQHYCGALELRGVLSQLPGDLEGDLFAIGSLMLERMTRLRDMIRWSLVEDDYEQSIFSKATWRPQEAIHTLLNEYMQGRVASGDLAGNPGELALLYMGMIFAHVMSRKKFPEMALYADPDRAIKYFIDVFLNGVRSK